MNVDIGIIKVRNPQSETFRTSGTPLENRWDGGFIFGIFLSQASTI